MGYSITELARRAHVRVSTVRFYERRGLLPAPSRRGGRRDYDASDLHRLQRILAARAAGFSVSAILTVIKAGEAEAARKAARERLQAIDAEIAHLKTSRKMVRRVIDCGCAELQVCRALG